MYADKDHEIEWYYYVSHEDWEEIARLDGDPPVIVYDTVGGLTVERGGIVEHGEWAERCYRIMTAPCRELPGLLAEALGADHEADGEIIEKIMDARGEAGVRHLLCMDDRTFSDVVSRLLNK